jgi:hypothetical protein
MKYKTVVTASKKNVLTIAQKTGNVRKIERSANLYGVEVNICC